MTARGDPTAAIPQRTAPGPWGRSSRAGSRARRADRLRAQRLSPAGARTGCRRLLPVQTFLSSSSSRPRDQFLGARRPASLPSALPRGRGAPGSAALGAGPSPCPEPAPPEPMAEAGRSPTEPPGEPLAQVAAEAPETEASAPPPAVRRLPGDPSPRGRSQSDLSSCSSRGRPLRVHISGSGKGGSGCWGPAGGRGREGAGRWQRRGQPGASSGTGPAGWRTEARSWSGEGKGEAELPAPPPSPAAGGRVPPQQMLDPGCSWCARWARVPLARACSPPG